VSNAILREYFSTKKVALYSTGDGNCLFNAVSTCGVDKGDNSTPVKQLRQPPNVTFLHRLKNYFAKAGMIQVIFQNSWFIKYFHQYTLHKIFVSKYGKNNDRTGFLNHTPVLFACIIYIQLFL
jgi:hypothetical protein